MEYQMKNNGVSFHFKWISLQFLQLRIVCCTVHLQKMMQLFNWFVLLGNAKFTEQFHVPVLQHNSTVPCCVWCMCPSQFVCHQSCTIYTEAPNVRIFHFHTVFIMKRLLKCRQILIWKAAASSRHMHLTESQTHKEQLCCWRDRLHHSPTTRQAHAHSHKEQLWCWRDRLHHSPTTSRLLGGYEAGSVFTTSAATKSSMFSVSSFSSATPSHQHSANTNKQHPNAERLKQTLI